MTPSFRAVILTGIAFSLSCSALPPEPAKTTRNQSEMVYVLETGKSYHTRNCRLKSGSKAIKLSEAKKQGYKACKVCQPA